MPFLPPNQQCQSKIAGEKLWVISQCLVHTRRIWYMYRFATTLKLIINPKIILEEPCLHHSWQSITMAQSPLWLQREAPHLPQHCPFLFDNLHPHLIHSSLDRLHSSPQAASRSKKPFCHSTPSKQTDRPTDQQTDKSYGTMRHVCSGKNTRWK